MTSSPAMDAALHELESALSRFDSPWLSEAPPGLSLDEIQEIAGQSGLSFPLELAALWEWHADPPPSEDGPPYSQANLLPGGIVLSGLEETFEMYQIFLSGDTLDDGWYMKPTWVPALREPGRFFWAETAVGVDEPVPLTPVDTYDAGAYEELAYRYQLGSISELIHDMARMLREGHWGPFNVGPDGAEVWTWNPDLPDVSIHSLGYRWAED